MTGMYCNWTWPASGWQLADALSRGMLILAAVALLVAAFLARRKTAGPSDLACPFCGGPIQFAYLRCPHCGVHLKKHCPSCSRIVQAEWRYCPACQAVLDKRPDRSDTATAANTSAT